ncbi:hypothetical protein QSV36_10485 [Pseudomonas sp. BCRC 81390]|uniref:hypothetical protein n=1 Tax=Pseudomonas sp. BCRC 81390 TaxID=3054778 RepID=UPI0025937683|nr:hypothetical protein [Pseudomonas sp. BCRC 81390]MDM3886025.1 hypothetical protein [Pseudomonas sp. BCRC 81390]
MQRTLEGMALAGEPLLLKALEAIRAHRDAETGGAPREEVERLRLLAESLYQAVLDFQLIVAGDLPDKIH